jgi:hypothetical protein
MLIGFGAVCSGCPVPTLCGRINRANLSVWVLPGLFPHRGNAHPITCDRRKFRKVVIWVLVVVIKLKRCPYVRAAWASEKVHPRNGLAAQIALQGFTTKNPL